MNLAPTPFDLNWRMFGIPVRIHPSFWLVALVFSWPLSRLGFDFLLIGVGCMFVSLLAHELAHALMFGFFRVRSSIICYSFGGLTTPEGRVPVRSNRIMVTLAGPFTNLSLASLTWTSDAMTGWATANSYTEVLYDVLLYINIAWGILNLLPIWPLDGGQVCRELWQQFRPRGAVLASLNLSFIVAIVLAAYSFGCEFNLIPRSWTPWWLRPGMFAGILFALLAVQNYTDIQNLRRSQMYYDQREPWR